MTNTIDINRFAALTEEEIERLVIEDTESVDELFRIADNADMLADYAVSVADHRRDHRD